MTKDEITYWLSVTENSRFKWTEDEIFRLNGRGSFYYTGGEDGIYMKIGKGGLLEGGTYEGAVPHIGEAIFTPAVTRQCADYNEAFTVAMEAGGKKFLLDMFSADAPAIPPQAENRTNLMTDNHETPDRKPIIRAYISNADEMANMFKDIERLRNGKYPGAWHDFPTTAEKIHATLKEIGVDGVNHTAYIVNNYDTDIPGLFNNLHTGMDIDELNYLAVKLSGMDELQLEKFGAALEYSVLRDGLADIINTAENLDCFDLQPAFSTAEYGEFLAEMESDRFGLQIKALEESKNPKDRELAAYIGLLEKHFDTKAYGCEQAQKEGGRFTKHGYVTKEKGLTEIYIGTKDIPPEYRVSVPPERKPQERPSALDKLAAAKEAVARADAEKPPAEKAAKSTDAEL